MRVLNISNYYFPHIGGIEQVARDISCSLQQNVEIKVFCFNDGDENDTDCIDGVDVIRAKCFAKIASQSLSFEYGRKLKQTINAFKPDLIIFHHPNPFAAHFLIKLIEKTNIKLVVWWHLDITKQKFLKLFFEKQTNLLLKRANIIVASSPNYIVGSPYLQRFKNKCIVIPNCVSPERVSYSSSHVEKSMEIRNMFAGKTICFSLGRHIKYKGIEYLIKASHSLDDSFVFLLAGRGKLTKKLMKKAKNDNKIIFLGKVSDDDMKAYLLACDVFCFPSITKNEAFGIALAEAMYFSKPSVTFTINGSGVNYVSTDRETGIEVPNGDYKSFANAIKELASNEVLSKRYGQKAHERVEELFLYENFNKNVHMLLKKVEADL